MDSGGEVKRSEADHEVINLLLGAVGGRERFFRSFDARSHFPEEAAERALRDALSLLAEGTSTLTAAEVEGASILEWQARFVRLWAAYQNSGARVMNWFITGPANFPVARNQKRMEVERRRWDEFYAHAKGAAEWARRRARSFQRAELSALAATTDHSEVAFQGGRMVLNTTLDRIQLIFDGRPKPEIITDLKSRAFRWSPREGAWQRQLTRNGIWAAQSVVSRITDAGRAALQPTERSDG